MEITNALNVTKHNDGSFTVIYNGEEKTIPMDKLAIFCQFYNNCKNARSASLREELWNNYNNTYGFFGTTTAPTEKPTPTLSAEEILNRGLTALINFFTEFDFEPNFRFVNTLTYKVNESKESAEDYINNYFGLMDNSYKKEISEKIKSAEFSNILNDLTACGKPKTEVNKRLKIYYGSAGTGKTTLAMKEADNRCIICNASMLPSDLMEDFIFVDGKATFTPSKLWRCMEEGKPIVLDEINLLPFDSLRFLQGILDGKTEFDYKGNKVTINDGFQVIGTMNLTIGGMTYGLPEPLVDRSCEMKKFSLTADMLAKAITE